MEKQELLKLSNEIETLDKQLFGMRTSILTLKQSRDEMFNSLEKRFVELHSEDKETWAKYSNATKRKHEIESKDDYNKILNDIRSLEQEVVKKDIEVQRKKREFRIHTM